MSSPSTSKEHTKLKTEDNAQEDTTRVASPQRSEKQQKVPAIRQPTEDKKPGEKDSAPTTNAPLAPPPLPSKNANGDSDYFAGPHSTTHLAKEPNPFENAFGGSSSNETPGKPQLPGVTSLTSPAPLHPGNTPAWPGSLRSGPLSPAMLTGPTGSSNDYFSSDHHFGGSFPTPNESSLRTGLTPGGGGSMFPQPSPNSQAIFNAIQSNGATPGTLDFHRTAMHARAASGLGQQSFPMSQPHTSAPADPNIQPNLDSKGFSQQQQNDPFEQHDANDAANGLFMLAQARGNRGQPQQYPPPQQQPQMNYMGNAPHMPGAMGQQGHEGTNNMSARAGKNSVASNMSGSTQNDHGDFSESGGSEDAKPQPRSKGKKGSTSKGSSNGRRKADDTPNKNSSNKRQKSSHGGGTSSMPEDMMDSDDDDDGTGMQDTKKMTDEEKRKNFLERNRVAALKCRQRKKQWLANLQQKVEIFSTENDALAATVTQLREEIVGLKTLLLAHKECPVSQAQGISGMAMQNIAGEPHQFANPYSMAMQGMQQSMQQGNMRR